MFFDKAIDCSKCGNVNMFEMYSNDRTRGHQFKRKYQQTYLKRHFSTRIATISNRLPNNVVLETIINKFKSSLSKVASENNLVVIMTCAKLLFNTFCLINYHPGISIDGLQ